MKILCLAFVFISFNAWAGSEVSYTRTQSSSSKGNKLRIGYGVSPNHKLGISYSKTDVETTSTNDKLSSMAKATYRYKASSNLNISGDLNKSDESYFFEGQGGSLQFSYLFYTYKSNSSFSKAKPENVEDDYTEYVEDFGFSLDSRVSLSFETNQKTYTQGSRESLFSRSFGVGLEQDLSSNLLIGIDFRGTQYTAERGQLQRAIESKSSQIASDITSYVSSLTRSSSIVYLDFFTDSYSLGLNYSVDIPLLASEAKYTSSGVNADFEITKSWSVSLDLTSGKSQETNSTSTTTSKIGLQYKF